MRTRGIKDLYLPKNISIHVKIILICAIFTPVWGLISKAEFNSVFLAGTFFMTVADLEILLLLSNSITGYAEKNTRKFEDTHSRKQVTLVYLAGIILFLIVALVVITMVFVLFLIILHWIKGWGFPDLPELIKSFNVIKVAAIALLCSTPFAFFGKWQEALKRSYELREQNLIFQNETLKNQVNPHFLFNSLNTLSTLVDTQAEIARHFIGRLSHIYRYILDNSSKGKVPLKSELEFIQDYFYLHKIRSEGKILLSVEIKDEDYKYEILPVSLQLLIENAIKHNMATLENPLKITIYTEAENIVVRNNIQKLATRVVTTKIGLKNLNERIRLISGKEIIVEEISDYFIVKLPLLS